MATITAYCEGCGKQIELTISDSIFRENGKLYKIYCSDCYKKKEESK